MKCSSYPMQKAQALVEFALILPLLLIFAFFILDFGRAVYYYSSLFNGAREGARFGSTVLYVTDALDNDDRTQISIQAKKHLYGIPHSEVTITSTITETDIMTIKYLSVKASYTYTPVTPFVSILLPSGILLETNSSMRIEPRVNIN